LCPPLNGDAWSRSMKPARLVVVIVIGVLLVAGAFLLLGSKRSARLDELQKQAKVDLRYRKADVYLKGTPEDKTYVDSLFAYGLEAARAKLDSFFSPPPSEEKYFTTVYQAMIDEAKGKRKTDLARSLHTWAIGQKMLEVKY
jgi:hypothetical protein